MKTTLTLNEYHLEFDPVTGGWNTNFSDKPDVVIDDKDNKLGKLKEQLEKKKQELQKKQEQAKKDAAARQKANQNALQKKKDAFNTLIGK